MNRPDKPTHRHESGARNARAAGVREDEVMIAPPELASAVRELRLQHSDLRRLLSRIAAALAEASSPNPADRGEQLSCAFREMWSVMLVHMGREERLVFPPVQPGVDVIAAGGAQLRSGIEWAQLEHEGFRSSITNLQSLAGEVLPESNAVAATLLQRLYTDFFRHVGEEEQLFARLATSGLTREGTR